MINDGSSCFNCKTVKVECRFRFEGNSEKKWKARSSQIKTAE